MRHEPEPTRTRKRGTRVTRASSPEEKIALNEENRANTASELYDQVVASGLEHDSHESDLYLRASDASRQLLACYKHRSNVQTFCDAVTGDLWYDVPFAYAPYWRQRYGQSS